MPARTGGHTTTEKSSCCVLLCTIEDSNQPGRATRKCSALVCAGGLLGGLGKANKKMFSSGLCWWAGRSRDPSLLVAQRWKAEKKHFQEPCTVDCQSPSVSVGGMRLPPEKKTVCAAHTGLPRVTTFTHSIYCTAHISQC